jgi:GxxExxY protein
MPAAAKPLLDGAITGAIIDAFYAVHNAFGFGYRELIYSLALERELLATGHRVRREARVMIYYRGEPLAMQRVDLLVDDRVVVEVKATEHLHPMASTQVFSYLCSSDYEVGLVLHFGREPVFNRVICENRLKVRRPS